MLQVNPPSQLLGCENAVLSGSGIHYHVPDFEGCLSIKSVVDGTAAWETEKRRFLLNLTCFASCIEGLFFFGAFSYVYFLR